MSVFERHFFIPFCARIRVLHIESSLWQIIITDVWTRKDPEEHLKERSCPPNLMSLGKSPELQWMRTQRKPAWVQVYHSLAGWPWVGHLLYLVFSGNRMELIGLK